MTEIIVRAHFKPYVDTMPSFLLEMWEAPAVRRHLMSQSPMGYRLREVAPGTDPDESTDIVFEAEDYGCSPMHAIDGPECVIALLGFLTLRPGDTDKDYFNAYTERQLRFADEHGDALGMYGMDDDEWAMTEVRKAMGQDGDE